MAVLKLVSVGKRTLHYNSEKVRTNGGGRPLPVSERGERERRERGV